MSLLRLLTTGKSLVGVKDTESRYRLTTQRLLPQFGRARNPFTNGESSVSTLPEACSTRGLGANGASKESPGIPNPREKPPAGLPNVVENRAVSTSASSQSFTGALRPRAAALLCVWKARMSGLIGRPQEKAAKLAIPRLTIQAVQGELSLDKIKVVRNDLSDADLEVVPAKQPVAAASVAPGVRTEDQAGSGKTTWRRVTTRMFGASKT